MSDTTILNDITQIVTAIGVILTALSSITNRWKLNTVEGKVDTAVKVAADTKKEAVAKVEEVKQAVQETRDAAVAVNAEVVKEVHEVGVAAGKAINGGKA